MVRGMATEIAMEMAMEMATEMAQEMATEMVQEMTAMEMDQIKMETVIKLILFKIIKIKWL